MFDTFYLTDLEFLTFAQSLVPFFYVVQMRTVRQKADKSKSQLMKFHKDLSAF